MAGDGEGEINGVPVSVPVPDSRAIFITLARQFGTRCQMNLEILTVLRL